MTTTATVTQNNHGMLVGDFFNVTTTSDAAAITVALKTLTAVTTNTFSFVCLNAGAAAGTVTGYAYDEYLINGGYLTIDQHTRYGTNQNPYAALTSVTLSASLGGTIEFNSTLVRLIPFDGATGNVPALGTTIVGGTSGASGILLGIYSALNAAPTTAGAANPATGFVLVRQWNSIAYQDNETLAALGSALVNGTDHPGWLEIVGAETFLMTVNRLNTFKVRGDWYDFMGVTTDGTRATTYQIPSNGAGATANYYAGVEVSTQADKTITAASWSAGSATYTATSHGFVVGQRVTVSGATPTAYNVKDVAITAVTSNTFTLPIVADPGTWSSGGLAYAFEFYPCAGSLAATAAAIATDAVRGKVCWIAAGSGLLRFGHDGTNSTGGYIPPSGLRIRIPNIFFVNCVAATPTVNVLPNATLATRYEFSTTGGGVIDIDKASIGWYMNINQPYSCALTHVGILTAMVLTECASAIAWVNVNVGQEAANTQVALTMSLCFAGGTMIDCKWFRAAQAGASAYVINLTDVSGLTVTNEHARSLVKAANATIGTHNHVRVRNSSWISPVLGGGRAFLTTCTDVTYTDTVYYDAPSGTTITTIPMYAWEIGTACVRCTFDGLTFGGLTLVQPYSGLLSILAAGCEEIKLRNIGTYASPLDMGGARQDAVAWTRVTTTATATKVAHGLKTNDIIYVLISSDVAAITVVAKTVASAPTADTFTFVCLNAGAASGTLSYYPVMAGTLVVIAAAAAANDVRVQRCYVPHLRTNIITGDNSTKNLLLENIFGDYINPPLTPELNAEFKGLASLPVFTAQTSVYGTHWFSNWICEVSPNMAAQSWTRATTTATVTSTDHGLRTGLLINVSVTSSAAAIVLGQKTVTVLTKDTFTFTCLNAGSASGTLTFAPLHGKFAILMNEATADTADQYTIDAGGAAFTSAGGLYMPTVSDQITFITPDYVLGHLNFPIAEAVMAGGTIGNYDITYAIDTGSGYSSFKNLYYPRPGGGGSNGSTNVTMTSTTGVAAGDYVWGTNIAPNAKVVSITDGTTVVVDIANIGVVSGVLRFNQMPSEGTIPSTGFKIKIRIKTSTANATAITSLYFFLGSTATERAYEYPLDPVTIRVTSKDASTSAVIASTRVYLEADSGGDLSPGTVIMNTVADGSGVAEDTGFAYTNPQPVIGRVRKGTSAPFYKTSPISGTITADGFDATAFMVRDE